MKNRAVFLDRDGVLNKVNLINGIPHPPRSLKEVKIYEDVESSLIELRNAGYILVIVTNQPDVARGATNKKTVIEINNFIARLLKIQYVSICFHDDKHICHCRKPKPGMLYDFSKRLGLDLSRSFMVGDRWRDIDAGNAAGCTSIFIDRGYQEALSSNPSFIVKNMYEVVQIIKKGVINEKSQI